MVVTRKMRTEILKELVYRDTEDFVRIEDKITSNSRWAIQHEMVFQDRETNKFYSASYSRGATECQDESPFEYEGESVDVPEVEPVEVLTTVYKDVL